MLNRNLIPTGLVVLLLVAGGAMAAYAQGAARAAEPRYAFAVEPAALALRPGGAAEAILHAKGTANATFAVEVASSGGLRVALDAGSLHVAAGERAALPLKVAAGDARPGAYEVVLAARDGEGHGQKVVLHVRVGEKAERPDGWRMAWEPGQMRAKPGADVEATLLLKSAANRTLSLALRDGPARGALGQEEVLLAAGEIARVKARIHVPEDARGEIVLVAVAEDASGERREARLVLHVARPDTAEPAFLDLLARYLASQGIRLEGKRAILVVVGEDGTLATAPVKGRA